MEKEVTIKDNPKIWKYILDGCKDYTPKSLTEKIREWISNPPSLSITQLQKVASITDVPFSNLVCNKLYDKTGSFKFDNYPSGFKDNFAEDWTICLAHWQASWLHNYWLSNGVTFHDSRVVSLNDITKTNLKHYYQYLYPSHNFKHFELTFNNIRQYISNMGTTTLIKKFNADKKYRLSPKVIKGFTLYSKQEEPLVFVNGNLSQKQQLLVIFAGLEALSQHKSIMFSGNYHFDNKIRAMFSDLDIKSSKQHKFDYLDKNLTQNMINSVACGKTPYTQALNYLNLDNMNEFDNLVKYLKTLDI